MERKENIRKFFNRKGIYRVLKTTLSFLLPRQKIDFILRFDGDSYTDSKELVVGLSQIFHDLSFEEIYIVFLALLGHEAQHCLSSDFKGYSKFIEKNSLTLVNKGINHYAAREIVRSIGNIIEDGRIENILVNEYPGYISKIQFLNLHILKHQELSKETSELGILMSAIWSLSKLGVYPKNYDSFKTEKIDKLITEIKPLIAEGIKTRTARRCFEICEDIIDIITPFLIEEASKHENLMDNMADLMDLLDSILSDENFNKREEGEREIENDKRGQSSHIVIEVEVDEKEDPEDEDSSDEQASEGSSNKEEDSGNSSSSKENNDLKDEDESVGKAEENVTGSLPTKDEESEKQKNEERKPSKGNGKEKMQDSDEGEEEAQGNDTGSETEEGTLDPSMRNLEEAPSDSPSKKTTGEKEAQISEDEISRRMNELSESLKGEVESALSKANKMDREESKKDIGDEPALTEKESKELSDSYNCLFEEVPNDFSLDSDLPVNVKNSAKKFRKDIEKIFKNKSMQNIHGQDRGILNPDDLYKIGLRDYNVFSIEATKNTSDYVVYILQDGSFSMHGEKELHSAYALSIIEEGLKGIVPFKLTTFTAEHNKVMHHVVKNWRDKSKRNYSYNFFVNKRANWANQDNISIRVATKELLRRPERDKILIVLSDGLPYNRIDTKKAIKEARKKKIHVVGIMFGCETFRKNHLSAYREMYERNIIATSPERIPARLTQVLKGVLIR